MNSLEFYCKAGCAVLNHEGALIVAPLVLGASVSTSNLVKRLD